MGWMRQQITRGVFGLQSRTTLLLTAVVFAATGLCGASTLRLLERFALERARTHAGNIVRAVAAASADAVESRDRNRLLSIANEVLTSEDLIYLVIADTTGQWLAGQQRGAGVIDHLLLADHSRVSVEPIFQPRVVRLGSIEPHVDVVYPVSVAGPIEPGARAKPTVGFIRLGLSVQDALDQLGAIRRQAIGLAAGIALLMVPLGYEIVRGLVRPIDRLSAAAHALAGGDLGARVIETRRDELGDLARAFNQMAEQLDVSHQELTKQSEELEDRVLQRTRELEEANQRLREAATRDSLTGLFNRRHFNDLFGRLFAEASRYDTDLTCMMIDLDNFKRVNDSLGHQAGDRLLQLVADSIRSTIREADVPVRYGGDEFAVLLPHTAPNDARASAERVLLRFREALTREMPEATVASLSIGLASRENDQPATAQELLDLADEALYLAKAGGKNRITVLRPALTEHARAS